MSLILFSGSSSFGVIGDKTYAKCNGTDICIGDVVEVDNECNGLVLEIGFGKAVMGFGATPIDELNITKIVKSHTELKFGDFLESGWRFMVYDDCRLGEEEEQQLQNKKTKKLGVMGRNGFCGVIGTETTVDCNGVTVCIGDMVRTEYKGKQTISMIIAYKDRVGVFGQLRMPIEEAGIIEIIKSHKELNVGDKINVIEILEVVELKGYK